MWTGPGLALAQLLDEHDALLGCALRCSNSCTCWMTRVEPDGLLLRASRSSASSCVDSWPMRPVRASPIEHQGEDEDQAAAAMVSFWPVVPSVTAFFCVAVAFDRKQVDANHRSPALPEREADRDRPRSDVRPSTSVMPSFARIERQSSWNGSNTSTGVLKRSWSACAEAVRRATRRRSSTIRSMRSDDGGRLEEVERLLDLEQHVLGHRVQHRA